MMITTSAPIAWACSGRAERRRCACLVNGALQQVGSRRVPSREIGQFTLADLVLILLVAHAVQPAMTGPDLSLGGGPAARPLRFKRCSRAVRPLPRAAAASPATR